MSELILIAPNGDGTCGETVEACPAHLSHRLSRGAAGAARRRPATTTAWCPISTPALKAVITGATSTACMPDIASSSPPAKPNPWKSPKRKATSKRLRPASYSQDSHLVPYILVLDKCARNPTPFDQDFRILAHLWISGYESVKFGSMTWSARSRISGNGKRIILPLHGSSSLEFADQDLGKTV